MRYKKDIYPELRIRCSWCLGKNEGAEGNLKIWIYGLEILPDRYTYTCQKCEHNEDSFMHKLSRLSKLKAWLRDFYYILK